MEYQNKKQVNFFKDSITKKLNYIIEKDELSSNLLLINQLISDDKEISAADFELIGNICYFIGTDITSMEVLCDETIINMRKRFEQFNINQNDILLIINILNKIEIKHFEKAKEEMKKSVNSEVVDKPIVLANIAKMIKSNLKKNILPVKFARDVEEICTKSKLCYNDLLKFNSLINQQYIIQGENLQALAKLYSNSDYELMINNALYYFDLQKFAVVYVDNIISTKETLNRFPDLLNLLIDEYFEKAEFKYNTYAEVREYLETKDIEEAIQGVAEAEVAEAGLVEGLVEGVTDIDVYADIDTYTEEIIPEDFNFANKPDIFIKNVLEEIADTKIDTLEKFKETIGAILQNDEQVSNTYQYMSKYASFEKRIAFEDVYTELNKEEVFDYIENMINTNKVVYEDVCNTLLNEIPKDNINRIVTYVNECIEQLLITDPEAKGYLMTQLIENQITTWKHLQQLIALIEEQNILGSGYLTYCNLANYLETKTDAKSIFDNGNELEEVKIRLSYFIRLKNFLFIDSLVKTKSNTKSEETSSN